MPRRPTGPEALRSGHGISICEKHCIMKSARETPAQASNLVTANEEHGIVQPEQGVFVSRSAFAPAREMRRCNLP